MCNNENEILNIDFSVVSDATNWSSNTTTPVTNDGTRLLLKPENSNSEFIRELGNANANSDRLRLRVNMKAVSASALEDTICAVFGIYDNNVIIDEFTVYINGLNDNDEIDYNLDRIYKFSNPNNPLELRISIPEGFNNELHLDYVIAEDYEFCQTKRTYFVFDGFLEAAAKSEISAIELKEWKVDGVETLTPAFFSENVIVGVLPANMFLAKADIDGSNREADLNTFNSFNPFIEEWGLEFSNANYFSGKPTGTTSGSDYGTGLLQIGIDKPTVLNRDLESKIGAFFIDIDYTKDLRIVIDVITNNNDSTNVFNSPDAYGRYYIEWDAKKCQERFYRVNLLRNNGEEDRIQNGFLSGLTGQRAFSEVLKCDESFNFNGQSGTFEIDVDLGLDTGLAGFDYNAFGVPDKFEIEWNGQIYSSGYVGESIFDQALINAGVPPTEINTTQSGSGQGSLLFNKTSATPTTAKIKVTAVLDNTSWSIFGRCPEGIISSEVEISLGTCQGNFTPNFSQAFINNADPINYVPQNGDIVYLDANLTTPFNGGGGTYRMRVTVPPLQVVLDYQFSIDANGVIGNVFDCSSQVLPTLILLSNITNIVNTTRSQTYKVGSSVSPGNRFELTVYSYTVTVIATGPDTPVTIAQKLVNAINNTTLAEWNSQGSAPPNGTTGYPPSAVLSPFTDEFIITLNIQNTIFGAAYVS